jgi:hypothetical protein
LINGGIKGENRALRVMDGIESCNGTFRQISRMTGLQEHELKGELEVLHHLGFVEVVSTVGCGRRKRAADGTGPMPPDAPSPAYQLTEKGKRAFASFFQDGPAAGRSFRQRPVGRFRPAASSRGAVRWSRERRKAHFYSTGLEL